jgi:hypothetical protein
MNNGHKLFSAFQLSSDSEEVAKANDVKTDDFIALLPVFTLDLLGVFLLLLVFL